MKPKIIIMFVKIQCKIVESRKFNIFEFNDNNCKSTVQRKFFKDLHEKVLKIFYQKISKNRF